MSLLINMHGRYVFHRSFACIVVTYVILFTCIAVTHVILLTCSVVTYVILFTCTIVTHVIFCLHVLTRSLFVIYPRAVNVSLMSYYATAFLLILLWSTQYGAVDLIKLHLSSYHLQRYVLA